MSLALRRYCLYPIMLIKVDGVPSKRSFLTSLAFLDASSRNSNELAPLFLALPVPDDCLSN